MTVSRGARNRRGGRRPGWRLLTALLILAIVSSSTIVFTDRVELLRLAVVVSLWAVVLAAFASLSYRRQGEIGEVRARDLKLVYDLQLDREIAARREYELSVEAYLRRQLSWEIRAEAADELAALRAELASLRSNLEAVLGTEFADRPALGTERVAVAVSAPPGRVESSRVTTDEQEGAADLGGHAPGGHDPEDTAEFATPILDVPEEPLIPPPPPAPPPPPPPAPPLSERESRDYRGSHRRPEQTDEGLPPVRQPVRGRHRVAGGDEQGDERSAPSWAPPQPPQSAQSPQPAPSFQPPQPPPAPPEFPPPRWAPPPPTGEDADEEQSQGQHTGGHSVADLLARLQVNPSPGGGRRRRDG